MRQGCKKGSIELDCNVNRGILEIGYCSLRWKSPYSITSYCNGGKHMLKGSCTFGAGSIVAVGKKGELTTGVKLLLAGIPAADKYAGIQKVVAAEGRGTILENN